MTAQRASKVLPSIVKARNGRRIGFAAALLLLSCESLQTAAADGETRTISMHHLHTKEDITVTFKRNGRYDDEALKSLNRFLRDWRRDEQIVMDPQLIDLLWEVQHELRTKEPLQIVCGYRAPATNDMLRRRSGGVARFSQHMLGKAMDFYIPGADLEQLRDIGLRLQRGGVGYYPSSGSPFVHIDIGNVRHWPRLTREQLVRVFPDGRTVHVPTDGHPLAGYSLALADIERRGNTPSATSLASAREDGILKSAKPGLFAKLFGFRKDKDEDDDIEITSATAKPAAPAAVARLTPPTAAPAEDKSERPAAVATVRLPVPRPATFSIASAPTAAASTEAKPKTPAPAASVAPTSPNDIFAARGYWQGLPETEPTPTAVKVAARTPQAGATAAGSPFSDAPQYDDKRAPELTLAYAAEPAREPARVPPMGASVVRAVPGVPTASVAIKQSGQPAIVKQVAASAPARATAAPAPSGQVHNQPWLRAVMLAPNVRHFLTATLLGSSDFRTLRPLMTKPSSAVAMSFSADPQFGIASEKFSGSAVVFVTTVLFDNRTAALQQ
ncbi:MAG: DUF882 domain-containing protein [Rhizobiales bacterium]|nr:DUF882 domain-containing protein [Hyphomicrobiales bacterium]